MPPEHTRKPAGWLSRRERGTLLGIQLAYWLTTALGRGATRWLAALIAAWYTLLNRSVRTSSRSWLQAVLERPVRLRDIYRHVRTFVQVSIDRVFLLRGNHEIFAVTTNGRHHLHRALDSGRGALLLGAHLGSFEAMRADGAKRQMPLNIIGHFQHAQMLNALFQRLNPELAARVIEIAPDSVDFIFEVKHALEAGQLVGTMGDRVGLNEKSLRVEFFGRPARLPTGPFVLASVLKCPVFLTFGLYSEPNRYDLHCEPFSDELHLPRAQRAERLHALVQRYATRLEEYCRKAPYNWFNFYDFWEHAQRPPGVDHGEHPALGPGDSVP